MDIKNIVLGVVIIILTVFVVVYGINIFFEKPDYEDYCSSVRPLPIDKENLVCPAVCVEMYEIIAGECVLNKCGSGCGPDGVNSFETFDQCEIAISGKNCYDLYDSALESYHRNLFLITLPLGIALVILGALVFGLEAVGAGLMGGGVGTILYGIGGYWRYSDNLIKFLLSLVGLIIVIKVAYWFNKKIEGKEKKK